MENEYQPNVPPTQQISPMSPINPIVSNWLNALFFTAIGMGVFGAALFIGIQIGKKQTPIKPAITVQQLAQPTQAVVNPTIQPTTYLTLTPTANLKTYTNTKDNYSLQYPSDTNLTFLDCSNSLNPRSKNKFILAKKENSGCEGQGEGWIIYSEGDATCNSTESWKAVSTEININNFVAKRCVSTFIGESSLSGPTEKINTAFQNNGVIVNFTLNDLGYEQLYGQILSTFVFTK